MTISSTVVNYLRLVRIANVFTTVSNIILGYFFFTNINNLDYFIIVKLISISALLYIGGVVLNDYFDIKIDKKERPWRPLSSNKITKKNALVIITFSFSYSLIFSFIMGSNTFIITLIIITLIFLYNKFLKNTIYGPINMGVIRSLNIVLGASQSIFLLEDSILLFDVRFLIPVFSEFFYVFAITILSRNETKEFFFNLYNIFPFVIIYLIIFFVFFFILLNIFNYLSLIPLLIFLSIISYSQITLLKKIITIQQSISYLIMLIVILDSVFITDIIGIYYSLTLSFLLIIPILFLSRKIYMT
ncbi:MAG TPA: UbiA family prenyltransferase [Nitrososphaeraceae archaeon]|nr:UbiA family prenyltransferase [Nitrososphaeraceae archaeon]